jgi:hypothetical protein
MTIKVYLVNGQIEEYPNAYIYWEWDESEKGTDSGFRINSMDRNFTSAVAFVHPGDCVKIEVTSEECDRVFKNPPKENIIPVNRWKIFRAIHEEHIRQDEKWGKQNNHPMFNDDSDGWWRPSKESIESVLLNCRKRIEENPTWFDILLEEFLEVFFEIDPEKQRAEMVQMSAVAVQIIEYLDRRIGE